MPLHAHAASASRQGGRRIGAGPPRLGKAHSNRIVSESHVFPIGYATRPFLKRKISDDQAREAHGYPARRVC